ADTQVGFRNQKREQTTDEQASQRASPPGRERKAEEEPDDDSGQCDLVRENLVLEIDGKQHDHRTGEEESHGEQRRQAEREIAGKKQRARRQFDDRITRRDAGTARSASASKKGPAENGHVLIPAQGAIARRAMRCRPRDRFFAREAVDAHVEKTADHETKAEQKDSGGNHQRGCPPLGSGLSVELGSSVTFAVPGSNRKGTPVGSGGTPRSNPARIMSSHDAGGAPVRRRY